MAGLLGIDRAGENIDAINLNQERSVVDRGAGEFAIQPYLGDELSLSSYPLRPLGCLCETLPPETDHIVC